MGWENIPNAGTRMWFAIAINNDGDSFDSIWLVPERQIPPSCLENILCCCISHCVRGVKFLITVFNPWQLIFGWVGLSPQRLLKTQTRPSAQPAVSHESYVQSREGVLDDEEETCSCVSGFLWSAEFIKRRTSEQLLVAYTPHFLIQVLILLLLVVCIVSSYLGLIYRELVHHCLFCCLLVCTSLLQLELKEICYEDGKTKISSLLLVDKLSVYQLVASIKKFLQHAWNALNVQPI